MNKLHSHLGKNIKYGRYNKTEIEQNMVPNRLDFTFTPKWMWIFMVNEYTAGHKHIIC